MMELNRTNTMIATVVVVAAIMLALGIAVANADSRLDMYKNEAQIALMEYAECTETKAKECKRQVGELVTASSKLSSYATGYASITCFVQMMGSGHPIDIDDVRLCVISAVKEVLPH